MAVLPAAATCPRNTAGTALRQRFGAAGYACLVFDYCHFDDSDGQPRQLLDINRQLEDWAAAIAYVRALDTVDTKRVIPWGSSFSGGTSS